MRRALLLALIISTGLWSCQRSDDRSSAKPVIALVMMTLNNPFFVDMEVGARQAAEELDVNLITQAPDLQSDVEKQMQIVENLVQRKVDALCIAPSGSKEIVPAIVKANRAGIPVLIVDSRIDAQVLRDAGGKTVTYIGSDNYEGGRLAGEYLVELLGGKGKIGILEGIPGHETGDQRLLGFHAAIDQHPEIEVVASQTANWVRDQGFNVFQNIMESNPEVQAVFAVNDMMALGAIEAIEQSNRTGDISVVGFDAVEDARLAIAAKRMSASVAQFPNEMGKLAVQTALRAIHGEIVPKEIPVRIELITRENLAVAGDVK